MSKENTCCLAKLLKVIDILQKNVTNEDCFSEGCTRPILAPTINSVCYNPSFVLNKAKKCRFTF